MKKDIQQIEIKIIMASLTGSALIGSNTAKGGFANEKAVADKFNNYKTDSEAQYWLKFMGYDYTKITSLFATDIPVRLSREQAKEYESDESKIAELLKFKKTDVQVRLEISIGNVKSVENLSLKKANKKANYNQIDKRPVSAYKEIWGFSDRIELWLKLFTGELRYKDHKSLLNGVVPKISNRIFLTEMPKVIQDEIVDFFKKNITLVSNDTLRGRGGLAAHWLLVTRDNGDNTTTWAIEEMNKAINFFTQGEIRISRRGSLYIGRITMQRKGGTPDPTSLQFKIHPCQIIPK